MYWKVLLIYLAVFNIAGYASMGIDKKRAVKHEWRIPEATLFGIAIFGGSIGSIMGMQHFRHKTKHWYFKYGMPLILLLQIALAVAIVYLKK